MSVCVQALFTSFYFDLIPVSSFRSHPPTSFSIPSRFPLAVGCSFFSLLDSFRFRIVNRLRNDAGKICLHYFFFIFSLFSYLHSVEISKSSSSCIHRTQHTTFVHGIYNIFHFVDFWLLFLCYLLFLIPLDVEGNHLGRYFPLVCIHSFAGSVLYLSCLWYMRSTWFIDR